jgi:ribosomal protein S4E
MPPAPETSPGPRAAWPALLPWVVAAHALLAAAWFRLEAEGAHAEAESLRLQLDLRDLELRDARNRREAERLLLNRQIEAAGRDASGEKPADPARQN